MLHFRRIAMGASKPAAPGINTDNYLTIEALEDGMTVSLSVNACEYCINGSGDWVALPAATATPAVNTGQTLSFKATGLTPSAGTGIGTFSISKKCNLKGNCMSMVHGDDAVGKVEVIAWQFMGLFIYGETIVSVSEDFLPATILGEQCYTGMFYGCSSLIRGPKLPALNLVPNCYNIMYNDCSNLNYIKAMFLTEPSATYTNSWVNGVSATGTFVKNAAATWDFRGADGIPEGWTVETAES